jgi:hypothetical protein
MKGDLEKLREELEEERLFQYLKRFGTVPEQKKEDDPLKEFN